MGLGVKQLSDGEQVMLDQGPRGGQRLIDSTLT